MVQFGCNQNIEITKLNVTRFCNVMHVFGSLGKVRVISCRETVPKGFKPNLIAECPETFQPKSGETVVV